MKRFIEDFLMHQWALFITIVVISFTIIVCVAIHNHNQWEDNINNPANAEFVVEVAFNLDIPVDSVTQIQFNERYCQ